MSNPSNFTAVCVATDTGYRLRVLSEGRDLVRLDLDDWEEFRPASAGHRLIEHGYTIRPDQRSADTVAGWRAIPAQGRAWSTIAVPTG
ncbi:hypothetical protein [Streptomyces sp. NPDC057429]|uniref:hypothetical protein n=1 Tax=Streptomyces sp. NPDC057429 TaxID=3346130 RepID=UPI0036B1BFBD